MHGIVSLAKSKESSINGDLNGNSDGLPKINIFCWIMVHGKLLTTENLQKREIQGPSRCALCRVEEEMIHHLFFEFFFSKLVWKAAFAGISH
jgi:hypothetical protein